jgi:hypothetical protein
MALTTRTMVRVDLNAHGSWDVALTGHDSRIVCDTLDDAREVASKFAAHRRPCELIVRDAYHRVVRRELLDGPAGPAVSSRRTR